MTIHSPVHLPAAVHSLPPLQTLLIGLTFFFSILLLRSSLKRKKHRRSVEDAHSNDNKDRIPGPYRLPFVGSLFVLRRFLGEAKHRCRLELAEKYGKIFSVAVANVNLVFLNDFELVKEAFVTKGV